MHPVPICKLISSLENQKCIIFFICSDAEEERKKEEMLKVAKKELEDWYKTHEEQIAKTKSANRYCSKKIIFSYSMLWFRQNII